MGFRCSRYFNIKIFTNSNPKISSHKYNTAKISKKDTAYINLEYKKDLKFS